MHSKRRYKICICSDILAWAFCNYKGFIIIFPKILGSEPRVTYYGSENFSLFLHHVFKSENFRFPFSDEKKKPNPGGEM